MAVSSAQGIALGGTSSGAFLQQRHVQLKSQRPGPSSPFPPPSKVTRCQGERPLVQASMRLHWAPDEKVVIGVGQSHALGLGRPNKRDFRVGAKWLHGLKGESKTGGSGSAGTLTFICCRYLKPLFGNGIIFWWP